MKVQEVLNCSFDSWFPSFSKITFTSRLVPIPAVVLDYLKADSGLVLPMECDSDQPDDDDGYSDGEDSNNAERPSFPDFCAQVRREIEDLGGAVLPKLNWSSPRDAAWMGVGRSLKCTNLSEVLLLLKSSDFVTHDLTHAFKNCEDDDDESAHNNLKYFLVLRKWSSTINPGYEFRCFVVNRDLVGISQRDPTQFYKHILEEKTSIFQDIKSFFKEHIQNKFQSKDYVFDVYRRKKDSVKLIDFNPFGPTTDSQLFNWEELTNIDGSVGEVDFRYIESERGIQPDGLGQFSMPRDFVDLASGTDPEKLVDFLKLQGRIQDEEDRDE